jgi:hypothetical protein
VLSSDAPLLREKYPDLSRELISLLEAEDESDLAICAWDLRIIARCPCRDDFCQSFYTAPKPEGPYGPGHRNLSLSTGHVGMLIIDVVGNQIMFVEVLDYPPLVAAQTILDTSLDQDQRAISVPLGRVNSGA